MYGLDVRLENKVKEAVRTVEVFTLCAYDSIINLFAIVDR
jgi:hypothetical protein